MVEIDPNILFGGIGALALIVLGLFYKGKICSFLFEKDGEKLKVEIKAQDNPQATILSPTALPARDRIESKGDVHVHNYSLDAGAIRKMLQEQELNIQKLLTSGPKDNQEKEILKKQLAGVEAKLADTEKALEDHKIVLTETQGALESVELKNAVSEDQVGEALEKLEKGDSSEAEALLTQVLNKAEAHVKAGAEAAYRLGKLAYDRIDYRAASKFYDRAVQLAPDNSLYLNQAGFVADTLAVHDKAIEYYENALAIDLKAFGPEHPGVAVLWNNLGLAWNSKGEYDKAIEYYEKALAIDLKTFGPEHHDVAIDWNNLGSAWNSKGDYDKAIEYFEKALAVDLKTFGPEHPSVACDWNNLGEAWREKNIYDKAIEYYEKALASDLKTFGPEYPQVAIYWNNLGIAWESKGDYGKAIEYHEKALASDLKTFGPDHPSVAIDWNNLGSAWDEKGDYDKAIEYYEKALASDLKTFGPEHPSVARGWNNLGLVAWEGKGDYGKAIGYYDKALTVFEKANLLHKAKLVKDNIADLKNQR